MARVKQPRRSGDPHRPHQGGRADALLDPDGKSPADDVRILEGLADHVAKHEKLPGRSELRGALKGCALDNAEFTDTQIYEKVRRLRDAYLAQRAAGGVGDDATEAGKYELCTKIWGDPAPAQSKKRGAERRDLEEMRRLYPNLTATVDEIASERGILGAAYKRTFEIMGDKQATKLEAKCKKERLKAGKIAFSRTTVTRQVHAALIKSTG